MIRKRFLPAAALLLGLTAPAADEAQQEQDGVQEASATAQPPTASNVRTSSLRGSAFLDRRNKVVGACVFLQHESDPSHVFLTTTDEDGRFRFDRLPDGFYRLEVRRDGLQPVHKDNVSIKSPFRAVVELPMQPASSIGPSAKPESQGDAGKRVDVRGKTVGIDGEPISEVGVRLLRTDAATDPVSAASGEDGEFELLGLPAGHWRLAVHGLGYLPIRSAVKLDSEVYVTLVMVPQPADYQPSPLELLPPERLIPPAALVEKK